MSKPTEQRLYQLIEMLVDHAEDLYESIGRDTHSQYDALLVMTISEARDVCEKWKKAQEDTSTLPPQGHA